MARFSHLTTFACVVFLSFISGLSRGAEKPNVLVIVTDEHNFRTLGCYRKLLAVEQAEMWGPRVVVETPHIDQLAQQGVLCTRAYATAPVCTPSRAAMITGLFPQNTGAPQNDLKLRDDVPTLAKILNADGYRSAFVGKWHLGGTGKPEWSPKVDGGFTHKTAMFNRGHWKKFVMTDAGPRVGAKDAKGRPGYGLDGADEKSFSTDFLTDRAIEFIEQESDAPFLTVVSYPDPHGPNTVRAPYDHMFDHFRFLPPRTYGRDDIAKPGWLSGNAKKHPAFRGEQMSLYFGMVKCLDDNIGRLLKTLRDTQQLDSTIIVLTSDHGDLCYEHDRLNKGNPYEGSARVPFLIRYPAKLAAGTVYRDPIGTVDLTPTIVSLTDSKSNAQFQGRDLSSAFTTQDNPESNAVTFLRNAGTKPAWLAVVDRRYKLIVSVTDQPWLMDIESDPDELLNFFGRPGTTNITRQLAKKLLDYTQSASDPFADHEAIKRSIRTCLQ